MPPQPAAELQQRHPRHDRSYVVTLEQNGFSVEGIGENQAVRVEEPPQWRAPQMSMTGCVLRSDCNHLHTGPTRPHREEEAEAVAVVAVCRRCCGEVCSAISEAAEAAAGAEADSAVVEVLGGVDLAAVSAAAATLEAEARAAVGKMIRVIRG